MIDPERLVWLMDNAPDPSLLALRQHLLTLVLDLNSDDIECDIHIDALCDDVVFKIYRKSTMKMESFYLKRMLRSLFKEMLETLDYGN